MPPAPPDPNAGDAPWPRWMLMAVLGLAAFGFLLWWALLVFAAGLGACGEDSSYTGEQYRRLCGGSGARAAA